MGCATHFGSWRKRNRCWTWLFSLQTLRSMSKENERQSARAPTYTSPRLGVALRTPLSLLRSPKSTCVSSIDVNNMSFDGSDELPSVQVESTSLRNHQTSAFERVLEQMVKQNEFTEKQTTLIVEALSKQTELLQKMSQTNKATGKSTATLEKLAVSGKHKNGSAALTLMIQQITLNDLSRRDAGISSPRGQVFTSQYLQRSRKRQKCGRAA